MTSRTSPQVLEVLREIPPLLPEFLRKRRAGLPAVREIAAELGLEPPVFFTLVLMHQVANGYGGKVTLAELRADNPYTTIDTLTEPVSILKRKGLVKEDEHGALSLSDRAKDAVERLHAAARRHLSGVKPLPDDELEELAARLEAAVEAIVRDPVLAPRPGSHLAGGRSIATFGADAPVLVRIERAIFDLWMARDDAHVRAWRDAGLQGPPVAVLTLLWSGKASTKGELIAALRGQQTAFDVESSIAYLIEQEYAAYEVDIVALTPQGVLVREDIEVETDRIYFDPWPPLSFEEATRLRDLMRELVEKLPNAAPPAG